jgi:excisionase family DNA binding protein
VEVALLTTDELAELLRTTRKAVYALVERRQLSGVVKIGRRILFRRDAVLDWLDRNTVPFAAQESSRW